MRQPITFNLLGPQGSGKGTQAEALVNRFSFSFFEAGGALRELKSIGSELGRQIASYIDKGNLVPDELITEVARQEIAAFSRERDMLFDGLMRSLGQMKLQLAMFADLGLPQPVTIFLDLDDETAIRRLASRRMCERCQTLVNLLVTPGIEKCPACGGALVIRHDDTPEAIKKRLSWYHSAVIPVVNWFREHGEVIDVDARPPISEVSDNLIAKVESYYSSHSLSIPQA